jgi:hypothetical protein
MALAGRWVCGGADISCLCRDTFIALRGLLLVTKLYEPARSLILRYGQGPRQGSVAMLPRVFHPFLPRLEP